MRIATWNINGMRARFDLLRRWLRERRPDIVGLQELKMEDGLFPHEDLAAEGYKAVVHGQKAWNGVAVLARADAVAGQSGLPGAEEQGARLIGARVGDLEFITVYCPNGKDVAHVDYGRKLAWFDRLADYLAARHRPDRPLVLCGDFNICPAPIDSWNEEKLAGSILHTGQERARIARLIDWGCIDLFRDLHPDRQEFSWWDYRGGAFHRRQGLRIDFLLATAGVRARLREVLIDRDYRRKLDELTPSDHAPVIADLD
ncbi:MAG TPA: exodeoxyribonuclease III [Candidatus Polarisedimenticolia bacterium]|nr:exodeoxyribonuclease III [Candidatus Polarisedimenticolia bacterium]